MLLGKMQKPKSLAHLELKLKSATGTFAHAVVDGLNVRVAYWTVKKLFATHAAFKLVFGLAGFQFSFFLRQCYLPFIQLLF
jgi:hypothetical protein